MPPATAISAIRISIVAIKRTPPAHPSAIALPARCGVNRYRAADALVTGPGGERWSVSLLQ
jgi:hypothetical protein